MPKLSKKKMNKKVNKSKSKQLGFKKEKNKSKRLNRKRNEKIVKNSKKKKNLKGGYYSPTLSRKAPPQPQQSWANLAKKCIGAACKVALAPFFGTEEDKIKKTQFYRELTPAQQDKLNRDLDLMRSHGLNYMSFFETLNNLETKLQTWYDDPTLGVIKYPAPNYVFIVKNGFGDRLYELDIKEFNVKNKAATTQRKMQLFDGDYQRNAVQTALGGVNGALRILYGTESGAKRRRITTTEITNPSELTDPEVPDTESTEVNKEDLDTLFTDKGVTTYYIEIGKEDNITTEEAFKVRVAIINWLAFYGPNFFQVVEKNSSLREIVSEIDSLHERATNVKEMTNKSEREMVVTALKKIGGITERGEPQSLFDHRKVPAHHYRVNNFIIDAEIKTIKNTMIGQPLIGTLTNDAFAIKIIQSLWNADEHKYSNKEDLAYAINEFGQGDSIPLQEIISAELKFQSYQ